MIAWYAVHTQPNAEARAEENLSRQGYGVYLPRYRRWVRHARRREIVQRPLFPRYLFTRFDRALMPWRPILSTIGVSAIVCGNDGPAPVPPQVVESLRAHAAEGLFDELMPARRLQMGDRVRITEGPLENVVGRLAAASAEERVYILCEILGRTVRAEVSAMAIEAA
jgi:transcriptional antiterminator RfaH